MSRKSQVICYTGVGAKRSGKHSESEFLKAMKSSAGCKDKCPTDANTKGWIEWSGAERTTAKKCDKMVKKNMLIDRLGKKTYNNAEALRKCVSKSCELPMKFAKDNMSDNNLSGVALCAAMKCQKQSAKLAKSNKHYEKTV